MIISKAQYLLRLVEEMSSGAKSATGIAAAGVAGAGAVGLHHALTKGSSQKFKHTLGLPREFHKSLSQVHGALNTIKKHARIFGSSTTAEKIEKAQKAWHDVIH